MKLTIALSQINTVLGNVEANLEKHLAVIEQANAGGIERVLL